MALKRDKNILALCLLICFLCFAVRIWEFLVLRTDQSQIGENFVHKLFGVLVIFACLKMLRWRWRDIGFRRKQWVKNIWLGLLLGFSFYSVAFLFEFCFLHFRGAAPQFLVSSGGFSLTKADQFVGVGLIAIVLFNIINVWMEEGFFRGLLEKILRKKYRFFITILISATLFGLWHLAMPFRAFLDGEFSFTQMTIFGIGYVLLAFIFGLKMSLLYKMTGSLWLGMADHFFNNTIINVVHITSNEGNDHLQTIRIILAQVLSFIFVVLLWLRYNKKQPRLKAHR